MQTRKQVEEKLAEHYTRKFGGNVWCYFDTQKRAYVIRGEGLPAHTDLKSSYPNGWSLLDYIKPSTARVRASDGWPTRLRRSTCE